MHLFLHETASHRSLENRAGASLALSLFFLVAASTFAAIIITTAVTGRGAVRSGDDSYGCRYCSASIVRLLSDCISDKDIVFGAGDGMAELELSARQAGTGILHKFLARGLWLLLMDPDEQVTVPITLSLESRAMEAELSLILEPGTYDAELLIENISTGGRKLAPGTLRGLRVAAQLTEAEGPGGAAYTIHYGKAEYIYE